MAESKIEWTDATWNPVTGCDRVSPGCANCYALTLAKRLKAMGSPGYQRDGDPRTSGPGFGVSLHPDKLAEPLRWRKPRRVFVNSMSDLFHDEVPDEFIENVFVTMARARAHTFQVLTKRPERALRLLSNPLTRNFIVNRATRENTAPARAAGWTGLIEDSQPRWPLPNVWLGVSIENARYTWRAEVLRQIPAAVRFISAEPLLGSLFYDGRDDAQADTDGDRSVDGRETQRARSQRSDVVLAPLAAQPRHRLAPDVAGRRAPLDLTGIDWVIIGGESGPKARPFHLEHAREIIRAAERQECCGRWTTLCCGAYLPTGECCGEGLQGCCGDPEIVGPAVFVKQLGAKPTVTQESQWGGHDYPLNLRDRKGGDWDEWPADLRVREFPRSAVAA